MKGPWWLKSWYNLIVPQLNKKVDKDRRSWLRWKHGAGLSPFLLDEHLGDLGSCPGVADTMGKPLKLLSVVWFPYP